MRPINKAAAKDIINSLNNAARQCSTSVEIYIEIHLTQPLCVCVTVKLELTMRHKLAKTYKLLSLLNGNYAEPDVQIFGQ